MKRKMAFTYCYKSDKIMINLFIAMMIIGGIGFGIGITGVLYEKYIIPKRLLKQAKVENIGE